MSPAYLESLAQRLSETALLDLELARQHVQALAVRPLPPQRPHREMY
jgi:hypothetical protein